MLSYVLPVEERSPTTRNLNLSLNLNDSTDNTSTAIVTSNTITSSSNLAVTDSNNHINISNNVNNNNNNSHFITTSSNVNNCFQQTSDAKLATISVNGSESSSCDRVLNGHHHNYLHDEYDVVDENTKLLCHESHNNIESVKVNSKVCQPKNSSDVIAKHNNGSIVTCIGDNVIVKNGSRPPAVIDKSKAKAKKSDLVGLIINQSTSDGYAKSMDQERSESQQESSIGNGSGCASGKIKTTKTGQLKR